MDKFQYQKLPMDDDFKQHQDSFIKKLLKYSITLKNPITLYTGITQEKLDLSVIQNCLIKVSKNPILNYSYEILLIITTKPNTKLITLNNDFLLPPSQNIAITKKISEKTYLLSYEN